MRLGTIIVAAGDSQRMGGAVNKALLSLAGRPLLTHVLDTWLKVAESLVVVTRPQDWQAVSAIIAPYGKAVRLAAGGANRAASVAQGLQALADAGPPELIAVQDAARPLTANSDIRQVIEAAKREGAAILAAPLGDTVRRRLGGFCGETLPREHLLAAQTPQIFRAAWLFAAYNAANKTALAAATDDASLVMAAGYPCAYVWAQHANFKLTYREDVALAEAIVKERLTINT